MSASSTIPARPWSGRLAFYHPTASNGGAAARLEFHAARPERDGCFFLETARQKTPPTPDGNGRATATFDWENKITVKLGLPDVCSLLLVLEGKCEQAGSGRGGLFHDTPGSNTVINLRRQPPPAVGYALEVSRKAKQGDGEIRRARVVLTESEAVALRCIFQHAVFPLVFGWEAEDAAPARRGAGEAGPAPEAQDAAGG
jgi:hypothetical protein